MLIENCGGGINVASCGGINVVSCGGGVDVIVKSTKSAQVVSLMSTEVYILKVIIDFPP